MANATWGMAETFIVGGSTDLDGTNDQYTAVVLSADSDDADRSVIRAVANSSNVIGFTDDLRKAGQHILVNVCDNLLARAGAAFSRGAELQIGANGTVIEATGTNPVIGYAQEAATAANQVVSITFRGKPAAHA